MDELLLREMLAQLQGLRRNIMYTWVTFGVALLLSLYLLIQEGEHVERYAYYKSQYENQKVELNTLTYRLNSLNGRIIALEKEHGKTVE